MGDKGFNNSTDGDDWTVVSNKRRKPITHYHPAEDRPPLHNQYPPPPTPNQRADKIAEPCWFYNNGGCRHKDGSEKTAEECKYLHNYSENVKRPPHLSTRKPCDKYNLEGECKWHDNCKYSHRNLTVDEWSRFYPGIPYTLKTNIEKRMQIETKIQDIEARLHIMEFKQDGISKDVQQIGQTLQQLLRRVANKY